MRVLLLLWWTVGVALMLKTDRVQAFRIRSPPPQRHRRPPPPRHVTLKPPAAKPGQPPPNPPPIFEKNGVRLLGGSPHNPRGRLEISTTDPAFTVDGAVAWRPVCDMYFDQAWSMCGMLGFSNGRMYHAQGVNTREPNDEANLYQKPVDRIACDYNPNAPQRHRRLLSLDTFALASPDTAPYTCYFSTGECPYQGPLVGIECSNIAFPPMPPSPPWAPQPPPREPRSDFLRMVGGQYSSLGISAVEPNVCPDGVDCSYYGRVEVLVDGTDGSKVWAPLCYWDDEHAVDLATLVCRQALDWIGFDNPFPDWDVSVDGIMYPPFVVPATGNATAGEFDPSQHPFYATTVDGDFSTATMVQELQLMVDDGRCTLTGGMFGVQCQVVS